MQQLYHSPLQMNITSNLHCEIRHNYTKSFLLQDILEKEE